jgi:hypothetical protein
MVEIERRYRTTYCLHHQCDISLTWYFCGAVFKMSPWELTLNVGTQTESLDVLPSVTGDNQVLTAVNTKMAVLWAVAPCRLTWVYRRFRGLYCLHHQGDNGNSKNLWNVGKLIPVCRALRPKIQPSLVQTCPELHDAISALSLSNLMLTVEQTWAEHERN